jgi:choline dehydrogenase-like flavoprotein
MSAGRYPWSADPHAGVKVFADYAGPMREACDVVVVGSGPGGAVVAKVVAEGGKDVVLLEEGPPVGVKEYRLDGAETMLRLLREGGMRASRGNVFMPTMQAVVLGGASLINSAICNRSPAFVFDRWAEQHGTHLVSRASLDRHYEQVEQFLGVEPTPLAVCGERNLAFKRGCDALGIQSEPCPRNAPGCKGSAECFTGCRNGAKTSTDVSYVPAAIRAGARVYTSARVDKVLSRGRRATGVEGTLVEPFTGKSGHPFEVRAKVVVLAAGCMATPVILQRSSIGNENGHAGRHLRAHPGIAVLAVYPHEVLPWQGATQGWQSMQFLDEGIKLEVLWSPPPVIATRFPGVGLQFKNELALFRRAAPFDVIADGHDSEGSVHARPFGMDPDIRYDIGQADVDKLHRGACLLSEIAFAGGAEMVLPGIHGAPEVLHGAHELDSLRRHRMKAQGPIVAGNHVFGTTRMGSDPKTSVVDQDGRCHETDNLYVADSGIIPASPAVNPMLTIMALADRMGGIVAARV